MSVHSLNSNATFQSDADLLGPAFCRYNISLRQATYRNIIIRRARLLATFLSDELISLVQQKERVVEYTFCALLFVDISGLYSLFDDIFNLQNSGSSGFSMIINQYVSAIVEKVYLSGGDVLKFTDGGILSLWKKGENEVANVVLTRAISCSFALKDALHEFETNSTEVPIKLAITAGSLTLSLIGGGGGDDAVHYVVAGEAVTEARAAIEVSTSSDPIIGESAWKHCVPFDYAYVLLDENHVKITEVLKKLNESTGVLAAETSEKSLGDRKDVRDETLTHVSSSITRRKVVEERHCWDTGQCIIERRYTIPDSGKSQLGMTLKSFLIGSIIEQIEHDRPLEHLTEMRLLTTVSIEVFLANPGETEIISLADKCYSIIIQACENVGCVEDVSLRESSLVVRIVFGARSYLKNSNHCRFGIWCAWHLLCSCERLTHVDGVAVGVATGVACCTVLGHDARHHYTFIGPSVTMAESLMQVSRDKVTCDYNTVVYSGIGYRNFIDLGLVKLEGSGKIYAFNFCDVEKTDYVFEDVTDLKTAYPILSRFEELELFGEILDEIGLTDRAYSGILIEGATRMGKSRILDAYVTIAKDRRISVFRYVLYPSFAGKPYEVVHEILRQILGAKDCKTMAEVERRIVKNLGRILQTEELCYLNQILRMSFRLSKEYIDDSDWNRHRKSMTIFDKILKIHNDRKCILLDNVQYMDYMSWQFLAHAMINRNIVLAMTILEPESWDELSRVETDIYKDKRLLRHTLTGLERGSLSSLACQFLDVQGISLELHDFIQRSDMTNPGWFELFFTLIDIHSGFDFVNMTVMEAAESRLFFPESIAVTKIPADLFPEETAPPVPWNKMSRVPVCLTNPNFRVAAAFVKWDIQELALEVFSMLSAYEQNVVKCATVLGKVFTRAALEMIIPNHDSLKTVAAMENLIRIRIFECASLQRRSSRVADLAQCAFMPRSTFSDMHHLLRCRCHLRYSREDDSAARQRVAPYAHCRFTEFKSSGFRWLVYDQITESEKKAFHARALELHKKDVRRCTACGGGPFLRMPGKQKSKTVLVALSVAEDDVQTVAGGDEHSWRDGFFNAEAKNLGDSAAKDRDSDLTSASFWRTFFDADGENKSLKLLSSGRRRIGTRNARVHPLPPTCEDANGPFNLNNFGHVDFRNCRCLDVIDCLFMKLRLHVDNIDNNDKIVHFKLQCAAALIDNGQPSYALRFLANVDERNDYVNSYVRSKNPTLYVKMLRKSTILCLRGKAYMLLGNYPQAQTNFLQALSLFKLNFSSTELFTCYKTLYGQVRQNIWWNYSHPRVSDKEVKIMIRQSTAMCLRLLSAILMINHQYKLAKLAALQSIVYGFSSFDTCSFLNQCELYLSFMKIYSKLGDLRFISHVEKYMLFAINNKHTWNESDDIVMLGRVYFSVLKLSLLRGNLERAVHFGKKSFRISKSFQLIRLHLELLPLLIQALMRLKRVCETMDTLQSLRDVAHEDVDKSALTWYYALCMDLLLDYGIHVESYEACAARARKILEGKSDAGVLRDPEGLKRLLAGLWTWQLRKGDWTSTSLIVSLQTFTEDLTTDNYSGILTLCKILECHLLLLTRCIDMKKGNQMVLLLVDVETVMKILDQLARTAEYAKPHFYLLKAYFALIHARVATSNFYLRKAVKCAERENNLMVLASIKQNRKTWKAVSYNNMARYWEENIGYRNAIAWQDVDMYEINEWSNILYSLPIPDSYI